MSDLKGFKVLEPLPDGERGNPSENITISPLINCQPSVIVFEEENEMKKMSNIKIIFLQNAN